MQHLKKPSWLKVSIKTNANYASTKRIVDDHGLFTICSSGRCPNLSECWGRGTATFMIGGDVCTRRCKFCNTKSGKPLPLDPREPLHVAESILLMKLRHAVVTSVDRDDAPEPFTAHWVKTIEEIRRLNPETTLELLIPDFQGRMDLVAQIAQTHPDIIGHNMETVRRLTPVVRSVATYDQSLHVIETIARSGITAKSGIMVGLGETPDEVETLMDDLRAAGCRLLTIGQYLQPSRSHFPVQEYVSPRQFKAYKEVGTAKGLQVESGPLVRSSYHAAEHFKHIASAPPTQP